MTDVDEVPLDVAVATCAGTPYDDLIAPIDELVLAPLRARGHAAARVAWDADGHDWSRHDVVVIRSTWDYVDRWRDFLAWTEQVDAVTTLANPADVVAWNVDKRYLRELEDRGAPIVPTRWLAVSELADPLDAGAFAADLRRRGWRRAVVKPTVDVGALGLHVVDASDEAGVAAALAAAFDRARDGVGTMVQPFLASIADEGELSLVFLAGRFSHAVRKRPAPGDHRVQSVHGGTYVREEPATRLVDLGSWVLEATGRTFAYARVDLLFDDLGTPLLGELELVEPDLYLDHAPEAADRLAAAVTGLVRPPPGGATNPHTDTTDDEAGTGP